MKKIITLLTALACFFSLLILPAAAEESADLLEQKLKETLDPLDNHYDYYGTHLPEMIRQANLVIYEKYATEVREDHFDISAEEYEEVLNRFFAPTAEDMVFIQNNENYGEGPGIINGRPLEYYPETDTYRVHYPYWDPLPDTRTFLGYKATSQGFDVFYGKLNSCFLSDVLPAGISEDQYAGLLNYPDTLEYGGMQFQKSMWGYRYIESVEKNGMKYSVELDGSNIRLLSVAPFTESECPDSFEKLPEVDDDLLSIMADIQALVNQYGPEIPDEVKNGTSKGTSCLYKPGADSYYVAIGDDTAAAQNSYVKLLAESMKLSCKNLAENGMLIEDADAAFLAANTAEIQKADLITIGFSVNGFAAVAVEEVLKNMTAEESYMQWDKYLPEEGVQEIEAVLARMKKYLVDNGMTGSLMGVSKSDALVVAAESLAFGTLAYIHELPRLIKDIQTINSDAQIIVVGMDNPMENSTIALSSGEKMELGVYVDQLIGNMDNASQTVAIENSNTTFVSAPDALNDNDNQELTENALILSYINGVKAKAKPTAEGQQYIRNQIVRSMRKKGDVNCDGVVNYNDALLILRYSIGLETVGEEDLLFAEVDGMEGVNYNDALKILRSSIGLDTLDQEVVTPEHKHTWQAATCTEPKTCTACGETEGSAKGHTWQEATATEPKKCLSCGVTEVHEHEWKEATCTEPRKCKTCGATEGTAQGHVWENPTCTNPATCSSCGAIEGIPNGHDWAEATCTEPRTCTICDETDGAALGHSFAEGILCSRCGMSNGATFIFPETTITVDYKISGTIYRSAEITNYEAVLENVNSQGKLRYKIVITGKCTYNKNGDSESDTIYMGYKLYDSEDSVIKGGIIGSQDVAVGDKFKAELVVFDLLPGETYTLVIQNP